MLSRHPCWIWKTRFLAKKCSFFRFAKLEFVYLLKTAQQSKNGSRCATPKENINGISAISTFGFSLVTTLYLGHIFFELTCTCLRYTTKCTFEKKGSCEKREWPLKTSRNVRCHLDCHFIPWFVKGNRKKERGGWVGGLLLSFNGQLPLPYIPVFNTFDTHYCSRILR